MNTPIPSQNCAPASIGKFNADEIRRLLRVGKDRGLIRAPGEAVSIDKSGKAATVLGNVRSQWMDIDPATAQRWLENNFRNRRMDEDTVAAYARDMVNGVWVPTHQGIAFNDRDELIDGQHRLRAIVVSGKTIKMMVTFDLPSAIEGKEMTTMDAVDRGRTRSVADQLKIQHGLPNGSVIAALARSLGALCYSGHTKRLSVGQTLQIYREFENPATFVMLHRSREHGLKQTGVLAGFSFAGAVEEGFFGGATQIAVMYQSLLDGQSLRKKAPMAHLRAFLTSDEAKLLSRGSDRGVAELVLQAIWLELNHRVITKLELGQDGVNHFRSLQPQRVAKIATLFQLPTLSRE